MQRSKEKLRAMREQLCWTQEQAARKLFVSLATLSRCEREGRGTGREAKNTYDKVWRIAELELENRELEDENKLLKEWVKELKKC